MDNPTGDSEIFTIMPGGTDLKQLTFNTGDDREPTLSPDSQKIAYTSQGDSTSNPGGDYEVYLMNASDGSGKTNLSNNGSDPITGSVADAAPVFSPDDTKIAYSSGGVQASNPQGDDEVYRVNALDGTGQTNLTNNGADVDDYDADFSRDGTKVAYMSSGKQTSNSQGDLEVYRMNTLDGLSKKNLSNDAGYDYNPDWGVQAM